MSFNTLTNPDTVNPSYGVQDVIRPIIDGHANWVHVETVMGTGTRRADVYRCLGSGNSFGTDFFIAAVTDGNGSTGKFGFCIGETYDSVNKRFVKGAPYHAGTAYTPAADGSYPVDRHVANENTAVGTTAGFLGVGGSTTVASITAPSGASPIYLSITNDRLIISIGSTHHGYIGVYDRNYDATTDPFPIISCNLLLLSRINLEGTHSSPLSSQRGVCTRDLAGAVSMSYAYSAMGDSPQVSPLTLQSATVSKDAISNRWYASRGRIQQSNKRPNLRGFFKDIVFIAMGDVSHGTGDTLTIDGVEHVAFYVGSTNWSAWVPSNV